MAKEEIKRHPQSEETEVTEETVEEVTEEESAAMEDFEDEETETEEQSVYDDADDEFMETIEQKPISPEKAAEKRKNLIKENEALKERVEELESIEELQKHQGWEFLMENMKSTLHILVDKEDSSLSKNAKKVEDIKAVREILSKFSSELYCKRNEIKANEKEIENLKSYQIGLFDENEANEKEKAEK